MTQPNTQAPAEQWKVGNEFAPYHPQASHVDPNYRDGWNACYRAALASQPAQAAQPEPVKPLFASKVAARKWAELQDDGARMQSIAFDGHKCGQPGTIDPWGVVRWGQTAQGAGEVVAWRDHVEQKLNSWRFQTDEMDMVGLDDFMSGEAAESLIDYVCDESENPTPAQPAPVVPDVQREIAAALALFPADLPGQTFRVGGYNNGQALEADNDTQFFSKKRVIALLEKLRGHLTAAATPTPPAQEAKSAFTKALEIRTAQGWGLTGEAIPVLYTDTINDQQVMRDDVWLCTTDALKPAQAAADARDAGRYRLVRRGQHWSVINGIGDTLRGDALDAAADAALATNQQGGK